MTGRGPAARPAPAAITRALAAAVALVLVSALAPPPAVALEVSLATSRTEVGVGEQFTLTLEVTHNGMGNLDEPTLPPLEHVRRVNSYSSRNFSYVNGRATSSLVVQIVMVADEEGTYTLGPVAVEKGSDRATSGTVEVKVTPARSSASARPSAPGTGSVSTEDSEAGDDLLVFARVDNDVPYVNEQVTYSFTFLRRVRLIDTPRYTAPDATGMWIEELDATGPSEVVHRGRRYHSDRIRTALFPTAPGEFVLGEAYLNATVEDRSRNRRRDPFDIFGSDRFGLFRSGREIVLRTEPIPLRVRPLPTEGKPADFSGAVGRFELSGTVDRRELKAGDPVTLRLVLEGEGNVKVIPAPSLDRLADFKVYESEAAESTWVAGDRIAGRKTWEFVLVPTTGGEVEIPPVRIPVFDPGREEYVVLATPAIPLDVEATALDEALARGDDLQLAKERIRLRQRDIRWVKPVPGRLRESLGSPLATPALLLAHFIPVVAFAGAVWRRRYRDRLRSAVRWARARAAGRVATRRLAAAKASLDAGDLEAYFGVLSTAMRGYVADRLHLSAANLDEEEVRAEIGGTEAGARAVEELSAILGACDSARFSPLGGDPAGAADLHGRARRWIETEEKR